MPSSTKQKQKTKRKILEMAISARYGTGTGELMYDVWFECVVFRYLLSLDAWDIIDNLA